MQRAAGTRCGPAQPPDPIFCTYADRDGEAVHWLKIDETCTAAFEREA